MVSDCSPSVWVLGWEVKLFTVSICVYCKGLCCITVCQHSGWLLKTCAAYFSPQKIVEKVHQNVEADSFSNSDNSKLVGWFQPGQGNVTKVNFRSVPVTLMLHSRWSGLNVLMPWSVSMWRTRCWRAVSPAARSRPCPLVLQGCTSHCVPTLIFVYPLEMVVLSLGIKFSWWSRAGLLKYHLVCWTVLSEKICLTEQVNAYTSLASDCLFHVFLFSCLKLEVNAGIEHSACVTVSPSCLSCCCSVESRSLLEMQVKLGLNFL